MRHGEMRPLPDQPPERLHRGTGLPVQPDRVRRGSHLKETPDEAEKTVESTPEPENQ